MITLPVTYYMSAILVAAEFIYCIYNVREIWSVPFLGVVLTIAVWYLAEPLYTPGGFQSFDSLNIQTAYDSVLLTLISLTVVMPLTLTMMRPRSSRRLSTAAYVSPERVFHVAALIWLILLAYGTYRMGGDLLGALYPISSRSGGTMWSRDAGAGSGQDGFIVSAAAYIYVLCLAAFGILYSLAPRRAYKNFALLLMCISWPWTMLQGSRNLTLAVAIPGLLAYLLFSGTGMIRRGIVFLSSLISLELVLRLMGYYRNAGFDKAPSHEAVNGKHLGLNMASELIYCIQYISDRTLSVDYGGRYLAEIANVIPRVIWPSKPLIGIDYAIARGFGGAPNDIGVVATISTGMIGGGVLNFGVLFGPIVVGILMSLWVGLLTRFHSQGTPLRLTLFLVGLGLTFNLGRDLTLLVVWPLVFGYASVRLLESSTFADYLRRRETRKGSTIRLWRGPR